MKIEVFKSCTLSNSKDPADKTIVRVKPGAQSADNIPQWAVDRMVEIGFAEIIDDGSDDNGDGDDGGKKELTEAEKKKAQMEAAAKAQADAKKGNK